MSNDVTKLGQLPGPDAGRDAIHVAVAPIIAGENLYPGSNVGLNADGEAVGWTKESIGIVDPFLQESVKKGQRFYLCLYPGTITSLRHVWAHPAFDGDKVKAEEWLREYAKRVSPYDDGARFMQYIHEGSIFYYGTDLHSYGELEEPEELFKNLSIVLGRRVGPDDFTYSCSC